MVDILVIGGAYDATGTSFFVSSDAGVTWTPSTDNGPFAGTSLLHAITQGGGLFVAAGRKAYPYGAAVATSTDGLVWTEATLPAVAGGELYAVTSNGARWVAVGLQKLAGDSAPWMITSLDGITWVEITTYPAIGDPPSFPAEVRSLAFGSGLWVAGFSVSQEEAIVAISADGLNWTAGGLTGGEVDSIAVIDGTIVTTGYGWDTGPEVKASTDGGTTWTTIANPFDPGSMTIRTDGARWVLLGQKLHPPGITYWYYNVAYSDDQGATWTLVDTGFDHQAGWGELFWDTCHGWMMLGYGQDDDSWPPTGLKGRVIYSTDLVTWVLTGTFWSIVGDPTAHVVIGFCTAGVLPLRQFQRGDALGGAPRLGRNAPRLPGPNQYR